MDDSRFIQGVQRSERAMSSVADSATTASRTVEQATARQAQSYQQLARDVERNEQSMITARNRAGTARDAAITAERRYQDVLQRSGASAEEIATAERQASQARANAIRAVDRAQSAIDTYTASQQRAAREMRQMGSAANSAEQDMRRLGRASEDAAQSTNNIGEGLQDRLSGAFGGIGDIAGQSGESGAGNFLAGFSGRVGSLGTKAGPIGMALVGVAALGLAAGAILANAIADGMEQEAQQDLIQAKLGINEDTARRIGIAAGAAYSNGWGESVAENMDAARAAIQSGLLTGEEDTKTFQGTIEQLNIVAGIMGEEIPALSRSASQAVKTGFAKDGTEALDLFVRAQQVGLNTSEDFLDTIDEYGIQFKKLGIDGPAALGLLSQAVKGGARDTDTAADALKEFSIRAIDGSKSSAEAYEALGMNAEEMSGKIAMGGEYAADGLEMVLDGLRSIEDPVKRNAAAVGLFGTKAEDMGDALFDMDLSTAVKQLGDVEGAARNAGDTMSSNTAASFDSAKRSIETSSADIKLALAGAFGPALTDLATWVTEHKPEIIAFFTGLADAGFATLDATLAFTSGALRAYAMFADGVGGAMAAVVGTMAMGIENAARFADIIPGMGDKADSLRNLASDMRGFAETAANAGDKARDMADGIDKSRPIIEGMRNSVRDAGVEAEESARLMQALGTTVVEDVPDNKTITISDNSPETVQRLQDLGMKVETTPNGIRVTATTDEAASIIHSFISQERRLVVTVDTVRTAQAQRDFNATGQQGPVAPQFNDTDLRTSRGGGNNFADGGVRRRADGMIDTAHIQQGSGQGIYTRSPLGPVQYAEGETQWEAYIPGAPSKRKRSEAILQDVARRFGFGLIKPETIRMADGGVVDKNGLDASMSWARSMDPATYLMGGFSSKAIDCSGAVSGAVNKMLGLDAFDSRMSTVTEGAWLQAKGAILGRGGPGTVRIGWWDKGGGANGHTAMTYPDGTNFESNGSEGVVVGGETGADDPQFDQHAYFPTGGDLGRNYGVPPDMRTEEEKIADTIISEGKKRGMSEKQIKAAVMAALEESRLQNLDYGMDGDNKGILQQRDSWGTVEDRKDPAKAAGMFYDELAKLDSANMTEAQMAQAVQRSGTADGSNYADEAAEAERIIAASNARNNGQMTSAATTSGAVVATDGQRVFVTNWPGTSSYSASESAPSTAPAGGTSEAAGKDPNLIWSGGFKVFENGGMNLPNQAGLYSDGADLVRFAEKGTGGESYIPLAPSKRSRSVAITRETARRFGYELVPMADGGLTGFGGYVGEKPGLKVPTTANGRRAAAYNAAAFGVGAAFALASGFDADGKLTGQFDTGANSSSQLEKGFENATKEIQPVLEQILLAIKNREPVNVQVDVNRDSGQANISILKGGI